MFQAIISLLRHTIVYGMGNVLTRMIAFLLLPIFTNHLTPSQYGQHALFYMAIGVAMEILRLGQDIALLRYYALEKDDSQRKKVFSTVFWAASGFSLLLTLVIWFGASSLIRLVIDLPEPYPHWTVYTLQICALIVLLDNLSAFPLVIMRCEGQPIRFSVIKLSGATIQVVATIIFVVYFKRGVQGIFEANLIASAVMMALCLPTIVSKLKLVFEWTSFRACMLFGLPNVPNSLFVVGIGLADRKILEIFRGAAEVGIYSAGYKLGMFLAIVAIGFRYAWQPFFLKASSQPDAEKLYARVLTYYLAVTLWLYLLLVAFVPPLAKWNIPGVGPLIDPEYWEGLRIFPIVLFAYVFDGMYAVFMVGVYLKKKLHALPFITGIAVIINVVGNVLLIPHYGMWASAWLTVAAYAVMEFLLYIYIQRFYPVQYEWRRIIHITAVAALVYAINSWTASLGMPIIGYALSVLFPLFLLASGVANKQELTRIKIK